MKMLFRVLFVLAMFLVLFVINVTAKRNSINDVQYIHQVLDMNQEEFLGHNAVLVPGLEF